MDIDPGRDLDGSQRRAGAPDARDGGSGGVARDVWGAPIPVAPVVLPGVPGCRYVDSAWSMVLSVIAGCLVLVTGLYSDHTFGAVVGGVMLGGVLTDIRHRVLSRRDARRREREGA